MASKTKTTSRKINTEEAKEGVVRGILGLALVFVLGSIIYSTTVIILGTDTIGPKIMVLPQAAFGLLLAFVALSKITK